MSARSFSALALVVLVASPVAVQAQLRTAAAPPARAIRRDIPLTNMIRRAFAAGTRDSTGRPGRNYWQLATEYTIQARLDAPTMRISGRETVLIHNNSDSALATIQLRLDQNLYAPNVPRAEQVPEITDGMRITRLSVSGEAVDLNPPPIRRGQGAAPARLAIYGVTQTTARITLPTPIAPHSTCTLEAEWSFKAPLSDNGRAIRMGAWGDSLVEAAQWYPRVAVYDDLRGWDTDAYMGPSEFYNNYGRFDVTIDAPAGWLVGATGVLQNPADVLTPAARATIARALDADTTLNVVSAAQRGPGQSTVAGDRLLWHFVADSVADFRMGVLGPLRLRREPRHHSGRAA